MVTKQDKTAGKGAMPLEGIRIIDWTLWQLGAVATAMLGSWGAEVIKLEERNGDPARGTRRIRGLPAALPGGRNVTHEMYSRNKKSVTVDLKQPEGKEIVYRLVEKSDVFVQNRRPGAAKRIGLDITEKEIQDEILAYPAFQFKGRFDETRYQSLLQRSRMKPEDFEESIAQELRQKKLSQFLLTFLPITDQEVLDQYFFSYEKVKISFVKFLPENFKESVTYDQASMEEYFGDKKEEYRIPEKIKIAHITIDPDKFTSGVTVSDQKIMDYYEDNMGMFKEEKQVKARHILFKLNQDASEEEEKKIKEKALLVSKKAKQGEDFENLVKEYSEGPSKEEGGDLGYFSQGQMVKPFEEAAFKMKKGEISDPVKTLFGYHVIKLEDIKEAKTKSLEEVREQITKTLINMAAMDLAHEKALTLIDQMPYEVDLGQYAARHDVPITNSDYFSQNEAIPDIGGDEKLRESIFSLQKNDVSELLESGNKFYIIQVVEKKPSYLPESKEVNEKLKEEFTAHLATGEARKAAEKYLAELKEGKGWDDLAKEKNQTVETTEFFTRNDPIPQIGYTPGLAEAALKLGSQKRYPDEVFEKDDGVFVIRWEDQKGIDEEKYKKDKEKYRYSLIRAKQQAIFGDWLENLKKKAEIEIVTPVSKE